MPRSQTPKAARRDPDGSRKFDHVWQAIKHEVSRERAAEQLKSIAITRGRATAPERLLPRVAEAIERDRAIRERLANGVSALERRPDRASAITAYEFGLARARKTR